MGLTNPQGDFEVGDVNGSGSASVLTSNGSVNNTLASTASGGFLGTQSNHDLGLYANGNKQLTVKATGGVETGGISIQNSSMNTQLGFALTINGHTFPNGVDPLFEPFGGIKLNNTSAQVNGAVRFTGSDFQGYVNGGWKSLSASGISGSGSSRRIPMFGSSGVTLENSIISQSTSGNIGINNLSPNAALDIAGDLEIDDQLWIGGTNGTTVDIAAETGLSRAKYDVSGSSILIGQYGTISRILTAAGNSQDLRISTNGADNDLVIDGGNGSVGVGTLSPFEKLHVDGNTYVEGNIWSTNSVNVWDGSNNITRLATNTAGAGSVTTSLSSGTTAVSLSTASSSGLGYVSVRDGGGSIQAGMYVDNSSQGVIFADVKNFVSDYPGKSDKVIVYASLEGPEAAAYERGTGKVIDGECYVQFSDHFLQIANSETMTIHLTPLSADSEGLAVTKKSAAGFSVKELRNGDGNYSFDWEVKCIRKGYENYRVIRNKAEYLSSDEVNRESPNLSSSK